MPEAKRRTSCDECRRRKVKCTQEQPTCKRCWDENMSCIYSISKPMGRPRKQRRQDNDELHVEVEQTTTEQTVPELDYMLFQSEFSNLPLPSFDEWAVPSFDASAELDQRPAMGMSSKDQQTYQEGSDGIRWGGNGCDRHASTRNVDFSSVDFSNISSEATLLGTEYKRIKNSSIAMGPPCSCLLSMYLAATNLENLPAGFPNGLTPIKSGLMTARSILLCKICPLKLSSSRQNVTLSFGLLGSLASSLDSLLKDVNSECARASEAGETKTLEVGDRSAANSHLHTGTLECPGRLVLELEPEEWRTVAKRTVKKHAFKGSKNDVLNLEALVEALEARQRAWHYGYNPSLEQDSMSEMAETLPESEWTCLRFTSSIRQMMTQFAV